MRFQHRQLPILISVAVWCFLNAEAMPQRPTGTGWVVLDVPSDVLVYFNDQPTRTTGTHREYVRHGLHVGKSYELRMRIVGHDGGKEWIREETIPLRAGERTRRVYRYSDAVDLRVVRRVPLPAGSGGQPSQTVVKQPAQAGEDATDESPQLITARVPQLPPVDTSDQNREYVVTLLSDLKLVDGTLEPEYLARLAKWHPNKRSLYPWATIEGGGDGEAYVDLSDPHRPMLALSAPKGHKVTGRLFLPPIDSEQGPVLNYQVVVTDSSDQTRKAFYQIKDRFYRGRLQDYSAGRAWFRHQARQAHSQLASVPMSPSTMSSRTRGESDVMKWFAVFTGGRAIAENLSLEPIETTLNRRLDLVRLKTIRGVGSPPINWRGMMPTSPPRMDRLASLIPADQHAVFFPSVRDAYELAEFAAVRETVLIGLADARGQQWRMRERYERQFGISLKGLAELLDPVQTGPVAVTGSDPHVAMGTDVAILIECAEPAALAEQLAAQIAQNTHAWEGVHRTTWQGPEMTAKGVYSADRGVCSFVAALPEAVVLTNSTYQLQRLVDVQEGRVRTLAAVPEYCFFRDRYQLGDPHETALVVISDATIRRWSGPRWRIGQARRLRAAAVLAEWQASCLDPLVRFFKFRGRLKRRKTRHLQM